VAEATLLDDLQRLAGSAPPVRDRMTTAVFLVAILHAIVILGVTFNAARTPGSTGAPSLEVIVVPDPVAEDQLNRNADYLAQVNQRGAGNDPDARGAESPRSAASMAEQDGAPDATGASDRPAAGQDGQADLVATRAAARDRRYFANGADARGGAPLVLVPLTPEASGADEGDELRLKGKASRELLVTANTRESSVAVYLDAWRRKVERIGTANYPMETIQKGGLTGNPVLEVQILENGTLGEAIIRRSSGQPELDRAALAILRLAIPYDRFPPRLAARHDALRLVYEWQFVAGQLEDSTVRMPADTR
jgi:protein TonB